LGLELDTPGVYGGAGDGRVTVFLAPRGELHERVDVASFRLGTLDAVEGQFQDRFERIRTARTAELEAVLDRLLAGEVDAATLARLSLTLTEGRVAMALFKG
jgi:hypothetical protein